MLSKNSFIIIIMRNENSITKSMIANIIAVMLPMWKDSKVKNVISFDKKHEFHVFFCETSKSPCRPNVSFTL